MNTTTKQRFNDFKRQFIHTITAYDGKEPDLDMDIDEWQEPDEDEEESEE
jgi:hypothetical protein